ncbi:hypothetical protein [Gracilibacillus kekensis]|uniref:Uncharacterized protein n=1 Tax=Gracilibacillus kekensis TaxID=1027249 RepID=A0A1M7NN88_9BACI|nr:hypothetical protein [Gracilibacillus kekensis]SHN05410.1 hypothetical protein SAMN05216179_1649 [Gracilibacillus kekensis]
MKWLVTALSLITVAIWVVVIFFYVDVDQKTNIYATEHTQMTDTKENKNANFIFRTKNASQEDEVKEVANQEETEVSNKSLKNVSLPLTDDNKVSIDELLSALNIKF